MPSDLVTRWEWHPVLAMGVSVSALGYAAIWWRQEVRSRGELIAWVGGLVAIVIGTSSAIDPLSDERLSIHMVQHELFTFVAAPLLVAGMRPLTLWLLPRLAAPLARWGHALSRPRTAWLIAGGVLWAWHWPPAYDYALAHPTVHDVEHATMLIAYALYWSPLTSFGHAVAALRTDAVRVVYLATGATQSAVLGALLAFSRTPFYEFYVAGPAGADFALRDQQLSGMIMLLSGSVVFVVAAVVTMRGE
ncbi:MAG TPA: cytochrome c oxidase assembly protein [Gemmatimonadales bacterium]|nr:cytochrome c oxidase assembly protein [Gemmatimonadales bacterium]